MANVFEYLEKYGGMTLNELPINNVDALVFSLLIYEPFDDIVSGNPRQKIKLSDAVEQRFSGNFSSRPTNEEQDKDLLMSMKESVRYGDLLLSGYINEVDSNKEKQFCVIKIDIGDEVYVSYRGTDSTLVGWKESLNMAFKTVPSQERAVDYLNLIADTTDKKIRVGGHSKGGNLAVYASSVCECEVQDKISVIYNFDGPGFNSDVIESSGFKYIEPKLKSFVPQSSVVGMLLEHEEDYSIVKSSQVSILQHDLYSWQISGCDFEYLSETTGSSVFIDRTLRDWMKQLDDDQRSTFVDALYSVFISTNVNTIADFTENWKANSITVLRSLRELNPEMRGAIMKTLGSLVSAAKNNIGKMISGS